MPTPPRTWSDGPPPDPVSATCLNGDLYTWNGQYFVPTGVRFHARKPIYKSTPAALVSVAATSYQFAYQGTVSDVVVDSSADYGINMDPAFWGAIQSAVQAADGTAADIGGGWHLIFGTTPIATSSSSTVSFGTAISQGGTAGYRHGAFHRGNTAHNTAPFMCDLLDLGTHSWSMSAYNGDSTSKNTVIASDCSGKTVRFHAVWACSDSGTTASAPAPKQSWSAGDTWTASFANGNTGVRDVLRYFNYPPCLKANTGQQSIPDTTATKITGLVITAVNGATGLDNYSGLASSTWTVPRDGIYLVHALIPYTPFSGNVGCGIRVNGTTTYWGPGSSLNAGMNATYGGTATKTQIFSLNASDTLDVMAYQTSGGSLNTLSGRNAYLVVAWLSGKGTPSPLPAVPDIAYRYTAGTPAPLNTVFNSYLANDLTFLSYRPYLLSYQASAQTGIAMATWTAVNMDTVSGIVHADTGDNYSGWSSTNHNYVAQRTGWYLCVAEAMLAYPSLTTTPTVIAGFKVTNNNPVTAQDEYGQQNMITGTTRPYYPGSTAVGLYYLRSGDAIQPLVYTADSSATTIATSGAAGAYPHFECVWVSE